MAEENKKQQAKQIQEQEEKQLVYIGPTLPGGKLKCNQIFLGTEEAIKNEIKEVLEENPLVEKMLVEVTNLAEKKQKVEIFTTNITTTLHLQQIRRNRTNGNHTRNSYEQSSDKRFNPG